MVSSVSPRAVRRGKAGTHSPAQPGNARCPPICPATERCQGNAACARSQHLAFLVSGHFQDCGDVAPTAEAGRGGARLRSAHACYVGSRKSAMASLREATLRKLRTFSELRGTVPELSSLAPCTEGAFPRTPCSFLSAAPSCPPRPGRDSQTFPCPPLTLCEPKLLDVRKGQRENS